MFGNLVINFGDVVFKNIFVVYFCVDIYYFFFNNDIYLYKNWCKILLSY